jgi:AcrR family transcriptional regulator
VATTTRIRARRGEGDRLREEILEAVGALLDETNDESAVSIRAIAERVGVSAPSIYRHFEDKEALLNAVCADVFAQLQFGIAESVAMASDPVDALARAGRCYIDFGLEHPEHYRLVFMRPVTRQWIPVTREELIEGLAPAAIPESDPIFGGDALAGSQAFKALHDLVADVLAMIPKRSRPDAFAATTTFWMTVHGITSLRITKPDFTWPTLDEQMATVMFPWRRYLATLP